MIPHPRQQWLLYNHCVRKILKWTVLTFFSLYLLLCVALYLRQAHFIFVPQRKVQFTPQDFGCAFENVQFTVKGTTLRGWLLHAPPASAPQIEKRALIYFHGNGGSIGANAEHACRLNRIGFSVFIFDYRGYGGSEGGPPTEGSVYEDAEAGWQYLAKSFSAPSIVIYGHSLGGAVAIEIAHRHPNATALVAESTFTSIRDMAERSRIFRLFPLALILNQRMDSLAKIADIHMPLLLIHGLEDDTVPFSMSERLYAAAPGRKQLFLVPGAGHENCAAIAGPKYSETILDFLKFTSPPYGGLNGSD